MLGRAGNTELNGGCILFQVWIDKRNSCSARWRSGTSDSSGCGSPTSSFPQVGRDRAGRARGRLRRRHRLPRSSIEGFAGFRVRHRGASRPVDLSGAALDTVAATTTRRECSATSPCPTARRLGRPAPRLAPPARQSQRPGLLLLRASRDRVLPLGARPRRRICADSRRQCRLLRPGRAQRLQLSPARIDSLESMGISVEFSHHEGRPASRRSTFASRTRCRWPTT